MDLGALIQAASAVVALSGVAVTRESLNQVRAQNKDLRDEVGDKDRRHAEDTATITRQASEVDVLRRVVTGEVQLRALEDSLDHHHTESMTLLRQIVDLLGRRPA